MNITPTRARHLSIAAVVVICGVVLSGPVAVALVEIAAPQPRWVDVQTFVQHYSWLQTLPYVFGFLIAGGFIIFMGCLVGAGRDEQRPLEMIAVGLTVVFASLVLFNYTLQTAFIPQWTGGNDPMLGIFTMANPRSLGWALEMYGYGILGIATAVAAPLFSWQRRQGMIRGLLLGNCIVSVGSAILVPIIPGWVLTPGGMVAGAIWNILVVVLMIVTLLEFRFGRPKPDKTIMRII